MGSILAIHLIESPDYDDFYANHLETDLIRPIAELYKIPFTAHTVLNREYFSKALNEIKKIDGGVRLPVLHFAGHGNEQGIGLSDGGLITWADLREMLIPVNERVGGGLFVCMSCCKGISAIRSALSMEQNDPYIAIVGTAGEPNIAQTSIAYATFYYQFNILLYKKVYNQQPRGAGEFTKELRKIVNNMSAASCIGWACIETENIKPRFQNAVMSLRESWESRS